jgi:GTPase SAR1 family protein
MVSHGFQSSYGRSLNSYYNEFSGAPLYLVHAQYRDFVNIAVCGAAGTGKSSLLNALLNMSPSDVHAAPVGIASRTGIPAAYPLNEELLPDELGGTWIPRKERKPFLIWDLPGAGSRRYPQESYTRDLGLGYFDIALVVSSRRVSEVDKLLVSELQTLRVPFFLVRTKLDIDVKNNELDHNLEEDATLDIVRKSLSDNGLKAGFVLSTKRPANFQLHELKLNLCAWLRVHSRLQNIRDTECPVCLESISGVAASDERAKLAPKIVQWQVLVDRRDGRLLGVDLDSDSLKIVVVLGDGLIPQWNADHPDFAVQAGDRIRLVNDLWEPEALIDECKERKLLEITIAREIWQRSDQESGPAEDMLKSLEMRPQKCYECGMTICSKCAATLALSSARGNFDAVCPCCSRLMSGASSYSGWFVWLWWWFF